MRGYACQIELVRAGEFQQVADHSVQPLHFLGHDARYPRFFAAFRTDFPEEACQSLDGAQRVAYFMGDARGHMTKSGQPVLTGVFPPEGGVFLPDREG